MMDAGLHTESSTLPSALSSLSRASLRAMSCWSEAVELVPFVLAATVGA
jgi:hypothetical protein